MGMGLGHSLKVLYVYQHMANFMAFCALKVSNEQTFSLQLSDSVCSYACWVWQAVHRTEKSIESLCYFCYKKPMSSIVQSKNWTSRFSGQARTPHRQTDPRSASGSDVKSDNNNYLLGISCDSWQVFQHGHRLHKRWKQNSRVDAENTLSLNKKLSHL